jgi:hypothetical protein
MTRPESEIDNKHTMAFEIVNNQIKKTKEDILAELRNSVVKNNAIGIFIKDTNELVTTAVKNIEETSEGDFTIILQDQDLHGYPLERNRLQFSNIERVIHFSIGFDDPQYVKVRRKEKFKV